jgi:pyridoxine 5-phosphate synthase
MYTDITPVNLSKIKQGHQPYIETAKATLDAGHSNAGHDLNLDNLAYFKAGISELAEVSIGHALICMPCILV